MRRFFAALLLLALGSGPAAMFAQGPPVHNDLDTFMEKVLASRDANWKKLHQYILDERERSELRGPGRLPIWGEHREHTWYVRDGYFIQSPLRFNGVAIGEEDRRKYEQNFLRREQEREKREAEREKKGEPAPPITEPPSSVEGLILQSREPQFVSSAYFMRFKFEPGRYALVGREQFDGVEVLRIEYYPTRLFSSNEDRRERSNRQRQDQFAAEMQRLMNKVSLVTLWVAPAQHQIVKYTFDNVGFDFLPMAWLVRVDDFRASMVMGQAFPDVWLPKSIQMEISFTLAIGRFNFSRDVLYHDHRKADVTSSIRVGGER